MQAPKRSRKAHFRSPAGRAPRALAGRQVTRTLWASGRPKAQRQERPTWVSMTACVCVWRRCFVVVAVVLAWPPSTSVPVSVCGPVSVVIECRLPLSVFGAQKGGLCGAFSTVSRERQLSLATCQPAASQRQHADRAPHANSCRPNAPHWAHPLGFLTTIMSPSLYIKDRLANIILSVRRSKESENLVPPFLLRGGENLALSLCSSGEYLNKQIGAASAGKRQPPPNVRHSPLRIHTKVAQSLTSWPK